MMDRVILRIIVSGDEPVWVVKNTVARLEFGLSRSRIMVRWSYVKGTSFVGVDLFRSEDGVRKDVMESLTCPHQGMLSPLMHSGIISNRVNSCVPKHLFLEGDRQSKNRPKTRECSLRRATNVTFSKFRRWRHKNKLRSARFFYFRAVLINE